MTNNIVNLDDHRPLQRATVLITILPTLKGYVAAYVACIDCGKDPD
jgi:hypothetical protein